MSSIFDDFWGLVDPFSSADIQEILFIVVALLVGYLFLDESIKKLFS
jgi:hypothetical protein